MTTKSFFQGGLGGIGPQANFTDNVLTGARAKGKSLWQTAPLMAAYSDPALLAYEEDDFTQGYTASATTYVGTQATSGSISAGTLAGGTLHFTAGAATAAQGYQIQRAGGHFIPAANKHIWWEAYLTYTVITGQFFIGIADIDTTILSAGALHATDCIGFLCGTGAGGVMTPTVSSASTVTSGATTFQLVTTSPVYLGFTVASNTSVQFYVNGVALGAPITTNIPSVVLSSSCVCLADGTGTPLIDLDLWAGAQIR